MKVVGALEIAMRTHPGVVRSKNEDSIFANVEQGLAIVADGLGGYNAGEVASSMTTMMLSDAFARIAQEYERENDAVTDSTLVLHRHIREQVAIANAAIFNAALSQPQYSGMGSTLLITCFHDHRVTVAHIGDSRLYRLRGNQFQQFTRDHSLLQEQLDRGMITPEEARVSAHRNLLTRALGVDSEVAVEIHDYEVEPGDIYLLCSDGLYDMVDAWEIGVLVLSLSANLEGAADRLVHMANENGGRDNVSVILVKIRDDAGMLSGWRHKLHDWLK